MKLTDKLRAAGEAHRGTELGGLLQWAVLHIDELTETLAESQAAHAEEEAERIRLERAMHDAKTAVEDALEKIFLPLCPPIELGRDLVPHINLMAGHGDPDYLRSNGMSIRHVDTRGATPKEKK